MQLLPAATEYPNTARDPRPSGRTQEIQRLIGAQLARRGRYEPAWRASDNPRLRRDPSRRRNALCASITGAYVALALACRKLLKKQLLSKKDPILSEVAAVSVGIIESTTILDLAYAEDSTAEVDMNVVCTGAGKFIELQGTAEREPFSRQQMDEMVALAEIGVNHLFEIQRVALNI
jgi:ribonuclease PH